MFPYSHAVEERFGGDLPLNYPTSNKSTDTKNNLPYLPFFPPRNPGTFLFTTYPFSKNAYINHGSRQVGNQDKNCVVGQAHATRNSSP